jgi:GT2 family glycosyltransferase
MNTGFDVSICIVSYNSSIYIEKCLDSILKWTHGINYEIIMVDNCSTDKTLELIRKKYPMVRIIENTKNEGFARATNTAVRVSRGEYLLLLNPDTELENNAIYLSLQRIRQYNRCDAATCKILTPEGCIGVSRKGQKYFSLWAQIYLQFRLYKLFPQARIYQEAFLRDEDFNKQRKLYFVAGCFLLISRNFYIELGMLDERFFLYGEDDDLCLRIRKAGGCIHYFPDGKVVHFEKGSSRPSSMIPYYYYLTNRFEYYKKNEGFSKALTFRLIIFLSAVMETLRVMANINNNLDAKWEQKRNLYTFMWALGLKKAPNI